MSETDNIVDFEGSRLVGLDYGVIAVYFCIVMSVGFWTTRRSKRDSMSGYFLASNNMGWIPVGTSVFASNIGSVHFIGLAGAGASAGIASTMYEITAPYHLMFLGWILLPVYVSSGIYTLPEFLKKRFGGERIRVYISVLTLLLYTFTKISADLYAGALFIKIALNKNTDEWLYISILFLLGIAGLFTIIGGLTAVMWTDFVQTILMVLGAFVLTVLAFNQVGGYQGMVEKYPYAIAKVRAGNGTCGLPRKDYMSMLRSVDPSTSDLPWTGSVFGHGLINGIWYWATDQLLVQRTLASKDLTNAKGGMILASYLKILPLWLMVFTGMISRILYPDRVACADAEECNKVCGNPVGCSNTAYAEIALRLLPPGLTGLMLAVMMASLITSMTSIFNSASTIISIDIWTRFRKKPSDAELLIVGRCSVVVLVIISILWIPMIQAAGNFGLFAYMVSVASFLVPPIVAVYFLGIFWERTNEPGAFWGLMGGLAIGMIRCVIQFSYSVPPCGAGSDNRPELVKQLIDNVHFLHFACILYLLTGVITVAVSLLTSPPSEEHLHHLTYWRRYGYSYSKPKEGCGKSEKDDEMEPMEIKQPNIRNKPVSNISKKLYSLCCVSSLMRQNDDAITEMEKNEKEKELRSKTFFNEVPREKRFVDINAVICLIITTFIIGFYA